PKKVAVNPVSGKIYVANAGGNSLSVVNGATHAVAPIALGASPIDLAINPATNRIYALVSAAVKVIDGANDTVIATVSGASSFAAALSVDPALNRIFVSNGPEI